MIEEASAPATRLAQIRPFAAGTKRTTFAAAVAWLHRNTAPMHDAS